MAKLGPVGSGGAVVEAGVNHLVMMATPDGRWVLPASDEFYDVLGDPEPDYDGVSFAVKNLGFIKIQVLDKALIEIELHPRNVERRALKAVQKQLLTSGVKLFRIKYFDGGWRSEISASAEHTVARLGELCAPVFRPAASDRFAVEAGDFSALIDERADDTHAFQPLAKKWRASFAQFDPTMLSFAVGHDMLPLLAIIGVPPRDRNPVLRFLGPGHRWAGEDQAISVIGSKVESLPDQEYGKWAAGFYRSAAESGQARYDIVTAKMRFQGEPGVPQRQVRYERLLLPWRTPSEDIFVTSCARLVEKEATPPAASDNSVAK